MCITTDGIPMIRRVFIKWQRYIEAFIVLLAFVGFMFLDEKGQTRMASFLVMFAVFKEFFQSNDQVEQK